jgi:hypothetical protein
MNIVFTGASVTAQGNENGFYARLHKILAVSSPQITLSRLAYGAANFYNMGRYSIGTILELKPDIVVIDWLSTGNTLPSEKDYRLMNSIYKNRQITPISLLAPRNDMQIYDSCPWVRNLDDPCIDLINIVSTKDMHLSDLLRDSVHTSPSGADFYAENISNELLNVISRSKPVYKDIDIDKDAARSFSFKWKPLNLELKKGDSSFLFTNRDREPVEIASFLRKGPNVPLLNIVSECDTIHDSCQPHRCSFEYDPIDQWSYYFRDALGFSLMLSAGCTLSVEALLKTPNFSRCPKLSHSSVNTMADSLCMIHGLYAQDNTLSAIL